MTRSDTDFAPPERADAERLEKQYTAFRRVPLIRQFLDGVPSMTLALNRERQIIYANQSFLAFLGIEDISVILGLRPGEALQCVREGEGPGGCGTSVFCSTCGAVHAILESQQAGSARADCSLTRRWNGTTEALELHVWTTELELGEHKFSMFSVVDASAQKRRNVLERIFFHDILNSAGGVQGCAELLKDGEMEAEEAREIVGLLTGSADQLVDEIQGQRTLLRAENGELIVERREVSALDILRAAVNRYRGHPVGMDRQLVLDPEAADAGLTTDPVLLGRVLGNLLKNALEATPREGTVTAGCVVAGDEVVFRVHNPTAMPEKVKLQVFQRSFSTKGGGRGLGNWSIKLLTERYLGGKVTFRSEEGEGTEFEVRLPRL